MALMEASIPEEDIKNTKSGFLLRQPIAEP